MWLIFNNPLVISERLWYNARLDNNGKWHLIHTYSTHYNTFLNKYVEKYKQRNPI